MFVTKKFKLFSLKAGLPGFCFACIFVLFASCVSAPPPAPVAPRPPEPEWTRGGGLHARFNRHFYLTAVGHGRSIQAAEMDAFRQLVSIFGVTVQADVRLAEAYRATGAASVHNINFGSEIILGAGMDNLIGAEIGDRWNDGRSNFVALAVLNRARATEVYSQMIRANQETINNLTNMTAAERNSFDGFSRYQFAAVIADMNANYAAVLTAVGSPQYAQGLRTGDDFRRGAREIAAAIPISVNVRNDRNNRIRSAFERSFADLGFRTGGGNTRYRLDVDVTLFPADLPSPNVVHVRYEINANLINTVTNMVLIPYSINGREGHRNLSEAENVAIRIAERRIAEDYANLVNEFLFRLLPR